MAAQIPDRICREGEWTHLYSNPLELYWQKTGKHKPMFLTLPENKRGYVATWEIRNQQLFLKEIQGRYLKLTLFLRRKLARFSIKNLFPRATQQPVKASWFSGKLRIPLGRMTLYTHHDYDSRFEKEEIITVDHGDVIKSVTLDYTHKTLVVHTEINVKPIRRGAVS